MWDGQLVAWWPSFYGNQRSELWCNCEETKAATKSTGMGIDQTVANHHVYRIWPAGHIRHAT
jgi:hypothetical protein